MAKVSEVTVPVTVRVNVINKSIQEAIDQAREEGYDAGYEAALADLKVRLVTGLDTAIAKSALSTFVPKKPKAKKTKKGK